MKFLNTLTALFVIFITQESSLSAMKSSFHVIKKPSHKAQTHARVENSKLPKVEDLHSYKQLLELIANPNQEDFKTKAYLCIKGCNRLIAHIKNLAQNSETGLYALEIRDKLERLTLQLKAILQDSEMSEMLDLMIDRIQKITL